MTQENLPPLGPEREAPWKPDGKRQGVRALLASHFFLLSLRVAVLCFAREGRARLPNRVLGLPSWMGRRFYAMMRIQWRTLAVNWRACSGGRDGFPGDGSVELL